MSPFIEITSSSPLLSFLTALIIGIGFGFALEQAGFSSSRKLAGMFYGYDAKVLKVFFTAAIVAMLGTQFLQYFGMLDMKQVYINPYFVYASIAGGIIMGAGFVMGGFCPGTGISALSIGKIDALFYLLGGAFGAFIFGEVSIPRNVIPGRGQRSCDTPGKSGAQGWSLYFTRYSCCFWYVLAGRES